MWMFKYVKFLLMLIKTRAHPFLILRDGIRSYICTRIFQTRSMVSWCWPLFGPHCHSVNPSEARATAGGLEDQLSSPPSVVTIGAAARRLGKVWQLKSFLGSVKQPPCVPLPHTPMGRWGQKGKGICLACKLAKTLAATFWWGVRKKRKRFL